MVSGSGNLKTIIIGLDGATFNVIDPLIKNNKLSFFKKLKEQSSYGQLKSTLPVNGFASWTSFFTGKNPGKHNIYHYFNSEYFSSSPQLINNASVKSNLLWHITDHYKLKSIYFNVPFLSEPEEINGVLVSGMFTPAEKAIAHPKSIEKKLRQSGFIADSGPAWHFETPEAYFNHIIETFETQQQCFFQTLDQNPCDVAVVTFNALDRVQKEFWNQPEKIELIYSKLDSFLEEIHSSIPEDAHFIVLSNHGFNKVNKKFFVNEWLWEHGLLTKKITTESPGLYDPDDLFYNHHNNHTPVVTNLLTKSGLTKNNIRSILPNSLSEVLKKAVPQSIRKLFHREYLKIEWDKTQAYFVSDYVQGININLKGREPNGVVEPGEQFEKIRDRIIQELYNYKDPYTFEHIIDEVYRKEELFSGEYVNNAPDIVIVPSNYQYVLDPNKRTSHLVISSAQDDYPIHSQRDRTGVIFISGPNIKQNYQIRNAHLLDVLPTALKLLELPVSADFDGNELTNIYTVAPEHNIAKKPDFIPADDIASFIPENLFQKRNNAMIA